MDWRTNAPKDRMPAENTYSVEAVRALDTHHMDLFNLIRAPNPTKLKIRSRPHAAHKFPILTLTANRVVKMEESAAATDSSGGTTAPKVPQPEDVPATSAPKAGQAKEVAATDPFVATESRKRGHDEADVNAPLKVLRRDHADPRPTGNLPKP
nr:hypothetical protein [Tanacetum cinerariifolium]